MEHTHLQKYTCPMHPEIVKDAPGKCPLCGMTLVPIAKTDEAIHESHQEHAHQDHTTMKMDTSKSMSAHDHHSSDKGGHAQSINSIQITK
ncbi:MAG: heavy metal-binding domain-containing protein [Chryseolinea sp.]